MKSNEKIYKCVESNFIFMVNKGEICILSEDSNGIFIQTLVYKNGKRLKGYRRNHGYINPHLIPIYFKRIHFTRLGKL